MKENNNNLDSIPSESRKMENLHIVFWLFKDLAWCLGIKTLGIAMIFPTIIISIIITYRTKQLASELCHNLAVTAWILANSYWMVSEFFSFDSKLILGFHYKDLAIIPFSIGILVLAYYYLYKRRSHQN
ncbi:MAG: hypothetical protein ACOVO1_12365 [Chitinophagaceae bacterium]